MLSSKDAEYKLAQSGDATCNGLDSAEVRDPSPSTSPTPTLDSDSNFGCRMAFHLTAAPFFQVGSRIMSLRKPPAAERCDFPAWFKGPRHWHALMGNAVYNYHSK